MALTDTNKTQKGLRKYSAMAEFTKRSHYVPVFLLKKWKVGDSKGDKLISISWRNDANKMVVNNSLGPKAYCYVDIYLFSESVQLKKDFLESRIFTPIDGNAAACIDKLCVAAGESYAKNVDVKDVRTLSRGAGPILSKFILSLMTRHPLIIKKNLDDSVKAIELMRGNSQIKESLKAIDPDLTEEIYLESIGLDPNKIGLFWSLSHINSKTSMSLLLNKRWEIITINKSVGSFILSDTYIYAWPIGKDSYGTVVMPLSPQHVLVLSTPGYKAYMDGIDLREASPRCLLKTINRTLATCAMRYVFSQNVDDLRWLKKILPGSVGYPPIPGLK